MGKKQKTVLIRMNSAEKTKEYPKGTGEFYTTRISKQNVAAKGTGKLKLKKYDKKLQRHCEFVEGKIK